MLVNIPSYLRELARDTDMVGRDTQVWLIAVETLDFYDYRALVPDVIAKEFTPPISKASVLRSLQRLIDGGYLERAEDNGPHGRWKYRLPLARIYPRRNNTDATLLARSKASL